MGWDGQDEADHFKELSLEEPKDAADDASIAEGFKFDYDRFRNVEGMSSVADGPAWDNAGEGNSEYKGENERGSMNNDWVHDSTWW